MWGFLWNFEPFLSHPNVKSRSLNSLCFQFIFFTPFFSFKLDNRKTFSKINISTCSPVCHRHFFTSGFQQEHMEAESVYHITLGLHPDCDCCPQVSSMWLELWTVLKSCSFLFWIRFGRCLHRVAFVHNRSNQACNLWTEYVFLGNQSDPVRDELNCSFFLLWCCRALGGWNLAPRWCAVKIVQSLRPDQTPLLFIWNFGHLHMWPELDVKAGKSQTDIMATGEEILYRSVQLIRTSDKERKNIQMQIQKYFVSKYPMNHWIIWL